MNKFISWCKRLTPPQIVMLSFLSMFIGIVIMCSVPQGQGFELIGVLFFIPFFWCFIMLLAMMWNA